MVLLKWFYSNGVVHLMPAEQWLLGDKYFLLLLVMLYAYDPPPPIIILSKTEKTARGRRKDSSVMSKMETSGLS